MKWPEIDWRRSMYRSQKWLERNPHCGLLIIVELLFLFLLSTDKIAFRCQIYGYLAILTALIFVLFIASGVYRNWDNQNAIRAVALVVAVLAAAAIIVFVYMFFSILPTT
jgi:hypothetical protein